MKYPYTFLYRIHLEICVVTFRSQFFDKSVKLKYENQRSTHESQLLKVSLENIYLLEYYIIHRKFHLKLRCHLTL